MNRHERRKRARKDRRSPPEPRPIRQDRVDAYCDWLESIAADPPPFDAANILPFADLTLGELDAVEAEMAQRVKDYEFSARYLFSLAGRPAPK